MPFISKDWRSPGEEWVKTTDGWEKKKILECGLWQGSTESMCERSDEDDKENQPLDEAAMGGGGGLCATALSLPADNDLEMLGKDKDFHIVQTVVQPHCHITIKCTREIAGFTGLSDAIKRLDFRSAVHDIRRFNYVCKLLDLIITQNLTTLPGCAQKVLFAMLEEVAYQVSSTNQNVHLLNKLLLDLRKALIEYYCWGRPIGSSLLWKQHHSKLNRINDIVNQIEIQPPSDDLFPKLEDLPEECIREILLRLADHKDLENSSGAYFLMKDLVNEKHIWRELCKFHFTTQQIDCVLSQQQNQSQSQHKPSNNDEQQPSSSPSPADVEWHLVYHKLRRAFGLREEYAEILHLCRYCCCLFWKSIGHPCNAITNQNTNSDPSSSADDTELHKADSDQSTTAADDGKRKSLYIPVTPQNFLKFFSL